MGVEKRDFSLDFQSGEWLIVLAKRRKGRECPSAAELVAGQPPDLPGARMQEGVL